MALDDDFQDAVSRSRSLPNQSNENLLKIYALYKQATSGDVSGKRPGMLDLKGRAKYDAWAAQKGKSNEEAKQAYVDLINKLGS
ncbi:MAG: acyl-CoA-binding protein [Deltaproteobacteria bacterium]|nr:MAG: acyl-CoA-binding protein [Deltaproteobacteria bacterium]